MLTAASRELPDHATLLRGAAVVAATLGMISLFALQTQPAVAQSAVPCTAIENDAERLACYDRALRPAPAPAPSTAAPAAAPPAAQRPAAAASEAAPREQRQVRPSAAPAAPAAPAAGRSFNDSPVPIVIVGVRTLQGRETTFTAEDGTRWVQTDSQQIVGLPDAPFEAELKPGAMGSRFLQPKNHPRAIRVRQLNR